jgi:dTDP-4-dehydrorhamnose reductase
LKKILLIGRNGQVGQELFKQFSSKTLADQIKLIALNRQDLNLLQPEQIHQTIAQLKPDFVINAAAYTAVDKAESEPELANAINGIAPGVMAQAVSRLGATLFHISTDYVFDGTKNQPYLESDPTNPIGIYGQSKLLGEEEIKNNCDRYIILRTAWVYGAIGHGNFVKTMLKLGAEREEIRVVADQIGTPTWSKDIAAAITQLFLAMTFSSGQDTTDLTFPFKEIFHFTNSGVASWYDFAVAIFEEAELLGFPLKIKRVVPITTAEYPTPAKRPAYSVLSGSKIANVLGKYSSHWRQSIRKMLIETRDAKFEDVMSDGISTVHHVTTKDARTEYHYNSKT